MAKRKRKDKLSEGVVEQAAPLSEAGVQTENSQIDTSKEQVLEDLEKNEVVKKEDDRQLIDLVDLEKQTKAGVVEQTKKEDRPVFFLEDAAHKLIYDYRPGWAPAIKVRARAAGLDPDAAYPLSVWREIFISWGGHGVVR